VAAPKGNRFWEARSSHGRKPIWDDPQELLEAATSYLTSFDTSDKAPTVSGLAKAVGISQTTIYDWAKREDKADFLVIVEAVREKQNQSKTKAAQTLVREILSLPNPYKYLTSYKTNKESGCKEWTGNTVNSRGLVYGSIYVCKRSIPAHRFSYIVHNKGIDNAVVRHKCDNPICINPEHLISGTQTENVEDMIVRGRAGWQGGS
jgi:hypothetical protein